MAAGNAFKMSLQELRDLMTFRGIEGVNKVRYTDKKENQIFFRYKEIQNGAVAKSYD
jgi:hypothetical protein